MKFQVSFLLFFLPAAFGWWNCILPVGGAYGTCLENGNSNTALACTSNHPCRVRGNGCVPLGSGLANCS
ncbi:hypothetical protein AU210_015795 [Fusarium oxysporum f. sp. radicis-cucumerinum]|uniref:Uncharacterized protein n=1 Tax=Fusarium oxysporum f. sp. radicis-cucumerinum TaxID=327505 RepID=A0A2H3GCK9_FUSOX|nr:hypothetical protein AU210_015795 [Fusarium oxysporum f. sp. radicis-cucumerinum]